MTRDPGRHARRSTRLWPAHCPHRRAAQRDRRRAGERADPCGAGGNQITCENSKPGTAAVGVGHRRRRRRRDPGLRHRHQRQRRQPDRLQDRHRRRSLHASTSTAPAGTRASAPARSPRVTPSAPLPQNQPQCITDVTTELYDCGNWAVSASWNVPADGGLRRLHRPAHPHRQRRRRATSPSSCATTPATPTCCSRPPTRPGRPTTPTAARTSTRARANGRAYKISYNRPFVTRGGIGGRDFYFGNEYPLVRFLEKNGYDVSYLSGVDTDRSAATC